MRYKLIAKNLNGGYREYYGNFKNECLFQFDNEYYRKGWQIIIYCNETGKMLNIIKSTYK